MAVEQIGARIDRRLHPPPANQTGRRDTGVGPPWRLPISGSSSWPVLAIAGDHEN